MDFKIRIKILLVFLIFCSFACNHKKADESHLILPGIGFDEFQIKKITSTDIMKNLGLGYTIDSHFVDQDPFIENIELMPGYNKMLFSISYTWDSLGLSFYFKPKNDTCISISFMNPFKGKTAQNIYLDSSTFNDVVKSYGEIEWLFTKNTIIKDYDSIVFSTDFHGSFPVKDSVLTTYLDKKVTEIVIH